MNDRQFLFTEEVASLETLVLATWQKNGSLRDALADWLLAHDERFLEAVEGPWRDDGK